MEANTISGKKYNNNNNHMHKRIEAELDGLVAASGRTEQPQIVGQLKAVRQAWADYMRQEADRRCREAALLRELDRVDQVKCCQILTNLFSKISMKVRSSNFF